MSDLNGTGSRGTIMKNIAQNAAESVITLAKKNVKDDINSTGSPWSYQPRMPKSAEIYKNK